MGEMIKMNQKQYFVTSGFFFVLMFYLMWFQATYFYPNLEVPYQYIKSAIVSGMILLSFPFSLLFFILGTLEPKK